MAEWFKAHAWNACWGESLSQVRILFSPPGESCSVFAGRESSFDFIRKIWYNLVDFSSFQEV